MDGHIIDFILIVLGFGVGVSTQFRLPMQLTIFMIRMIKWWFDTHPHGKEMAARTNFDEEFDRLFGIHIHEQDGSIPAEPINDSTLTRDKTREYS
jgi:hypothetical protein